ncbi:LOW QUALITY PROTEIN: ornithine decarboxylase antizyme 1 [Aethina tumida]|uniref:LOW QUALITY PROTEIN: ornithine decarboxylase antizyme 1 n=1 Tax=Aethina tumida TaxID=116153 RepID=UPI00096B3F5C|nr:LOW QUALITY PROTEIN: ornithine decarboxylase antizyme 1 [Aethina tumida]
MTAITSTNESFMMSSSQRSALSASQSHKTLGTGPLWGSDDLGDKKGDPPQRRLSVRTRGMQWDAVLCGHTLYVAVPECVLPNGSREGFVALLEAAEEELECKHVIVVFSSERKDATELTRTFMFFGFGKLAPSSPLIPRSYATGHVCMLYNIE